MDPLPDGSSVAVTVGPGRGTACVAVGAVCPHATAMIITISSKGIRAVSTLLIGCIFSFFFGTTGKFPHHPCG
jgi:hypothetical protein